MTAFYSHTSPDNPLAAASLAVEIADHSRWRALHTALDPTLDVAAYCASVARVTGMGAGYIQDNLDAITTLDELPRLRALQAELHHIDMCRLRTIDRALAVADRAYFADVDEELTRFLTPTRPHQLMPSARKIRTFISDLLLLLDDTLGPDEPDPTPPTEFYHLAFNDDGSADLSAHVDEVTGLEIDACVRKLAARENLSMAQALHRLVTGDDGVQVILNVYRANDIPDAPAYLPRVGWLNARVSTVLVERAGRERDMADAAEVSTAAYVTPADLEAFLEGRDGVCQFPGCQVDATFCDNDHTVNHADGGPTDSNNMLKLCRRHHNLKTSGRVAYVRHGEEVIWLLGDGTWLSDTPSGPLSTESKLWLRTFDQRRQARNDRARAESQSRKVPPPPDPDLPECLLPRPRKSEPEEWLRRARISFQWREPATC